jgi:hypothetical protein
VSPSLVPTLQRTLRCRPFRRQSLSTILFERQSSPLRRRRPQRIPLRTNGLLDPRTKAFEVEQNESPQCARGGLSSTAAVADALCSHLQEETLPRKDALAKFGITDRPDLTVQVVEQQGGPSLVDVRGPGDPVKTITPNQARELSILLRDAGEEALGEKIATAAARVQTANRTT